MKCVINHRVYKLESLSQLKELCIDLGEPHEWESFLGIVLYQTKKAIKENIEIALRLVSSSDNDLLLENISEVNELHEFTDAVEREYPLAYYKGQLIIEKTKFAPIQLGEMKIRRIE